MGGESDEALVQAFYDGDDGALNALVDRHHERLVRYLFGRLRNLADAEDVAEETWLRVLLTRAGENRFAPGKGRFSSWLFRITHNCLCSRARWRASRPAGPLEEESAADPSAGGEGLEELIRRESAGAVRAALDRLEPWASEVIFLRFFEELGYEEMGEALGVSTSTAHKWCAAALGRLRESLAGAGR